ncbi:DEAD/DEAH box helicase family protein [Gemmata sp. JC673]|uniref:DEAD/DEAH box helicase family protein n=1 Tax=Gemmata algarum TaxID=2975278 RepID=A0ABU5F2S7_9BACT|nr:DEAD/DEAH box helicase family protein [Gemmata algarum]MDY3560231.1 DEAD/DEAH box helicase family protein [Gemmata algarum]
MSHFAFLQPEWPDVYDAATRAESAVHPDPRTACFYARRALELLVHWVYKHDSAVVLPYQDNLGALVHEPTFKNAAGDAVFNKAKLVTKLGNNAVHSQRAVSEYEAQVAVKELFHVGYWLAHTYAKGAKPPAGLAFDPAKLPTSAPVPKQTTEQLQKLETQLHEKDEKLSALLADKNALDAELAKLRAEIAEAKKANTAQADTHDYSEAETRDYFIDLLLKEAGWPLDQTRDREFPVTGMPNNKGEGYVDYVLWGDDGLPLALIEAKRTKRDARVGQQQAKLYADCLEKRFGRRPVVFYSNGYDHWLWDDANYPPRAVQGFYKKPELELLIQRRTIRRLLATADINSTIVERYYQTRAIRRIGESFETDKQRKALVVMATGAGKTRTVIALVDLLMRCNWAKRVLFLADRVALVNQACNAFKKFLPDCAPVNLVTEKGTEGRVFVSTYPTMMGLIDDTRDGQRRFGVGHFDLVVIDEAHRSVFQKYRAIFDYFDALLVGLTATPKDELDRNTYGLFDLETGVPTDAYSLEDAVKDGFLVPARGVAVPVKFQRDGICYDDLPETDKDEWDAKDWGDDGVIPAFVEPPAVNKWLFNEDTVDKVLAHLMTNGLTVAGGDRIGKTIIFAKNEDHARYIAERFDKNYPHLKGEFARVITFKTEYAQSLIDAFSQKDKAPHIAISVDMLDTGIDVPEVVNLVFFKMVRSKTKFWQMVGRGTRLCPDLFGPGLHKKFFCIFDYCENLEFFRSNPDAADGSAAESLSKRLFKARLELVGTLDKRVPGAATSGVAPNGETDLRRETAERLQKEVAAMNVENFVVRPKRRLVEAYANPNAWAALTDANRAELAHEVAGLPSEIPAEPEEAKRFDYLMLRLQLAILNTEPSFERLRDQVKEIAGLLEEKASIPMVHEQMALIQDLQSDEWWQDVTAPMLEPVRKRLRLLVQFIEKTRRVPVYTDFEDELGAAEEIALPGIGPADSFDLFREKARAFLRKHQGHPAICKLRGNIPLSSKDLADLEALLAGSGVGSGELIEKAKTESHGLGLFVRSLVGLDREAAKHAFAGFLAGKSLSANQIEFVNLVIDHLSERGVIEPALLYESPFTDITPHGPEDIFTPAQVSDLVALLGAIQSAAMAA